MEETSTARRHNIIWVNVATELSCICECFEYIHASSINC